MTEELFLVKLARGLEEYKITLEEDSLPRLKQAASTIHSSFKNIYGFCLEKKLINADQYSSEISIKELKVPSSESFSESERIIEMSVRISAYSKQLDFLNSTFSFQIENLNLKTLKQLSDLISYIDWTSFTENSGKMITRSFASTVGTLKLGMDQLQLKVIKNDLKRLREEAQNFKDALKKIVFYRKEQYKAELRKRIAFDGKIDYAEDLTEDIQKNIRLMMLREMKDVPFYNNLISQLIEDDRTAPASWEKLLKKISPREEKTVKTKGLDKNILLKTVKDLAKASLLLTKIINKFDENSILINRKKRNIFEKIAFILSETFNKNKQILYDIEIFNAENTVKKTITLDYIKFTEDLKNKTHRMYLQSTPENLKKLSNADDEEILIKIATSLDVYKRSFRKLTALDTFFKEKSPKPVRSEILGVKVELNGIQIAVTDAQKNRNEYISQKEEIDQLKKLGIQIEEKE